MNGYLLQILTLSLLCGLLELLTPAGEREGLRRAVRLLSGLCLLCLMLTPLRELRDTLTSFDLGAWLAGMEAEADYEALMEEKLTVVSEAQVKEEICDLLRMRFGIARENCGITVSLVQTDGGLTLQQVWIALRGSAVFSDPRPIEAAVSEALGCGCTVSVG